MLDLNKDKKGGRAKTHTESVKVLQIVMAEHSLMDAWRILRGEYAADKKAKLNRKEEELEKNINVPQNLIESSHIGEQEKQDASIEQEEKKTELEKIIEYRTKVQF